MSVLERFIGEELAKSFNSNNPFIRIERLEFIYKSLKYSVLSQNEEIMRILFSKLDIKTEDEREEGEDETIYGDEDEEEISYGEIEDEYEDYSRDSPKLKKKKPFKKQSLLDMSLDEILMEKAINYNKKAINYISTKKPTSNVIKKFILGETPIINLTELNYPIKIYVNDVYLYEKNSFYRLYHHK